MDDERKRQSRRGCLIWLGAAALRGPVAAQTTARKPPASKPDPTPVREAAVLSLMDATYGRFDRSDGSWQARHEDEDYRVKPVAVQWIDAPGGQRLYVFVSGSVADEAAVGSMVPGVAGAHVLEASSGAWVSLAATPLMAVGSRGFGPESARLVQMGPDHYHGWLYETTESGQGLQSTWRELLAPLGRRFVRVASVLASRDNAGAYEYTGRRPDPRCESLETAQEVDRSDPAARIWPLVVRRSGYRGARALPDHQWRIAFDTRRWRYAVPAELQNGW